MSGLKKRVFHDCDKPHIDDVDAEHRWICECKTEWTWSPMWMTHEVRTREHWWSRSSVTSERICSGYWHTLHRTSTWQDVAV